MDSLRHGSVIAFHHSPVFYRYISTSIFGSSFERGATEIEVATMTRRPVQLYRHKRPQESCRWVFEAVFQNRAEVLFSPPLGSSPTLKMRKLLAVFSALTLVVAIPQNAPAYAGDGKGGVQGGAYGQAGQYGGGQYDGGQYGGGQYGGGGDEGPLCQGLAGNPQCCQLNALGLAALPCDPRMHPQRVHCFRISNMLTCMQRTTAHGTSNRSVKAVLLAGGLRNAVCCLL